MGDGEGVWCRWDILGQCSAPLGLSPASRFTSLWGKSPSPLWTSVSEFLWWRHLYVLPPRVVWDKREEEACSAAVADIECKLPYPRSCANCLSFPKLHTLHSNPVRPGWVLLHSIDEEAAASARRVTYLSKQQDMTESSLPFSRALLTRGNAGP